MKLSEKVVAGSRWCEVEVSLLYIKAVGRTEPSETTTR